MAANTRYSKNHRWWCGDRYRVAYTPGDNYLVVCGPNTTWQRGRVSLEDFYLAAAGAFQEVVDGETSYWILMGPHSSRNSWLHGSYTEERKDYLIRQVRMVRRELKL